MIRRIRLGHSAAFKAKLALVFLKGERALAERAEQFDVHPNQIQDKNGRLIDGTEDELRGNTMETAYTERKLEELHAKVGQLTMGNNFLSKFLGRDR